MPHVNHLSAQFNFSPALPAQTKVSIATSPLSLMQSGFNIPVSISTASSIRNSNPDIKVNTVIVMAHFDTGASKTSIDQKLAGHLGLSAVGLSPINTAAGSVLTPNYAVDISFPGTRLSPFANLPISSCNLSTNISDDGNIPLSPQNIGLLLGRDVMSRWNIVWNGPTSTVFISD